MASGICVRMAPDGFRFGTHDNSEGRIFLSPQSWSVLSGHADAGRAASAMQAVRDQLATPYGLMICDPPYVETDYHVMRAVLFNPGMKETAASLPTRQGWAVIAETMLGHGDLAWQYSRATLPARGTRGPRCARSSRTCIGQFTHSKASPRFGASRVPWLSGSAAVVVLSAVTQHILGLRPEYGGLRLDPWHSRRVEGLSPSRAFSRGGRCGSRFTIPTASRRVCAVYC